MTNNTRKNKPPKKQLNLRVKSSTLAYLEKNAEKYECFIRGGPSISHFLDKIGDGTLVVLKKAHETKQFLNIQEENYCVNFEIKVHNYPGVLAKITRILSDWETNIIGLEATSIQEIGHFDIIALIPANLDPKKILDDINRLTFNGIRQYAEESITHALKDKDKVESQQNNRLVLETKCSLSIEIVAQSRKGLLADLTLEIAKEKINLISAYRDTNDDYLSISHFHLEWTTLEQIKKVIEKLKKVPSVEEVKQTEASEIIKRFERIRATYPSPSINPISPPPDLTGLLEAIAE